MSLLNVPCLFVRFLMMKASMLSTTMRVSCRVRRGGALVRYYMTLIEKRKETSRRLLLPVLAKRAASSSRTTPTGSFRTFSSVSKNNNHVPPNSNKNTWSDWLPSLLGRLMAAFGAIHVVSEYGLELTLCEGPSMMPTILPKGEIILVDRLTPRVFGLDGGDVGSKRAEYARELQQAHLQEVKKETDPKQGDEDKWYQPMIPVNELSKSGSWKRFFVMCFTGICVGDVVVVQHPDRTGTVCKRVLGLPGDVVVQPPSSYSYPSSSSSSKGLLVIPDGHLWIEGDNSMNSSDSRNYGPIPAALVVGRVLLRLWPLRGRALMERGARPMPSPNEAFSGSTILPAGYEGEVIVRQAKS